MLLKGSLNLAVYVNNVKRRSERLIKTLIKFNRLIIMNNKFVRSSIMTKQIQKKINKLSRIEGIPLKTKIRCL